MLLKSLVVPIGSYDGKSYCNLCTCFFVVVVFLRFMLNCVFVFIKVSLPWVMTDWSKCVELFFHVFCALIFALLLFLSCLLYFLRPVCQCYLSCYTFVFSQMLHLMILELGVQNNYDR